MQENKQSQSLSRHRPFYKLPYFWIILIILVIAGVLIVPRVLAKPANTNNNSTTSTSVSTSTSTPTTQDAKTSTENATSTTTTSDSDGKTPAKYDGEDPNTSASLTGSLTTARFSGDKLIIRVNIDQYLSSGTCSLIISDGVHQLAKTANLTPSAATSTCEGFDIPSAELASFSQPLTVSISLASGDKTGTIEGQVE